MSWEASAYVRRLEKTPTGRRITRSEKLLLLVLADLYNNHQRCAWPSLADLARDACCSREWASRALGRLQQDGLILIERRRDAERGNVANLYRFPALEGEVVTLPPIDVRSIGGVKKKLPLLTPDQQAIDLRDQYPIDLRHGAYKEQPPVEPPGIPPVPTASSSEPETGAERDDAVGRVLDEFAEATGAAPRAAERRTARELLQQASAAVVVAGIWGSAARAKAPVRTLAYCRGCIEEFAQAGLGDAALAAATESARRMVQQRRAGEPP